MVLALGTLACAAVAGAVDGEWERVADKDGITVERRNDDASGVREVRATARSPLPPAAIMAVLWSHDQYVQFVPYVKRLEILRDEGDVRLFYEQFAVPFVKDRDATMRATRTFSADTGVYEMATVAVPDEGPRETSSHVRIRMSVGRWRLVPDGGGTAVSYTLRTDAGGLVPDWLANAAQRTATTKLVRAVLDRAARQDR